MLDLRCEQTVPQHLHNANNLFLTEVCLNFTHFISVKYVNCSKLKAFRLNNNPGFRRVKR